MLYHDSENPTLTVGKTLYSISGCDTYVKHNYEALKNQLERKLGLVPAWKSDLQINGVTMSEPVLNEEWKPLPWTISRIVTHPTGFQTLYLECALNSRHSNNLTIQSNEVEGAFVESFDAYVSDRMQVTADRMVADKKRFDESQESERKAQREIDLIAAKKLLARDAAMPSYQRDAMHTGQSYAASIRLASKLVTSSATSAKQQIKAKKQRVIDSKKHAQKQANGKRSAESSFSLAQAYTNQAKGRLKRAKAKGEPLPDLEADLRQKLEAEALAKTTLNTFQC